jgi:hypothetical protein
VKPIDRTCPACKVPPGVGCLPFGVKPGCGYPMKGFHRERRTRTESISAGPIEGPGRCDIEIRWNAQARAFFVDYGNVHFSVTRLGAILLGDALREAVRTLTVAQYTGHDDDDLMTKRWYAAGCRKEE